MAGARTDIELTPEAVAAGGLHVLICTGQSVRGGSTGSWQAAARGAASRAPSRLAGYGIQSRARVTEGSQAGLSWLKRHVRLAEYQVTMDWVGSSSSVCGANDPTEAQAARERTPPAGRPPPQRGAFGIHPARRLSHPRFLPDSMNSLFHSAWTRRTAIVLLAVLPLAAPAAGKASSPAGVVGCLLTPIRVADVGTPAAGVIDSVEVDRGDPVRAGQVLARLRSDTERASLGSAQTRADADATIGAAKAAAALAHSKLERAENLFREQFISSLALDQARAETRWP
jgi:hypothetical protein